MELYALMVAIPLQFLMSRMSVFYGHPGSYGSGGANGPMALYGSHRSCSDGPYGTYRPYGLYDANGYGGN